MADRQAEIERLALCYDPFSGDETDVKQLHNRFVNTRTEHDCNICLEKIPPRSRVRALTERNNEERSVMTFYFCPACCVAMAAVGKDAGEAIEQRTAMGQADHG